jgi:hypothetical protein
MADYIKKHETQAAYTTWAASENYVTPNVSLIDATDTVVFNPYIGPQGAQGSNSEPGE